MFQKFGRIIRKIKIFLFNNKDTRQTVAKNVFWLGVSQIGSRFIRAAIIIYAARILGAAEYGIFSYVLSLTAFFTIFSDLGVSSITTREVSKYPEKKSYYFSTSLAIKIILLLTSALLVIIAAPHFSIIEKANALIPIMALLVIFDGLREFFLSFFRAAEKMELEAFVNVLTNLTITISGFIILYFSVTAEALTITYVASTGVGALAGAFILRNNFKKVWSYFDKELMKKIFSSAWPLTFSAILGTFMLNTDVVMLGWWRSPAEIGYYGASQRIVQVLYTLPGIIASAMFPTISRLVGQNDKKKAGSFMEKSVVSILLIAIPMVIGGIVLGSSIIDLIYGKDYAPAALSFKILMITILLIFPGMIINNFVIAYDKQKLIGFFLFFAAVFNIIFNALLIPKYGIAGAAFATIVAQIINTGLTWRLVKKLNNFNTLLHLKKIIAAAIIMGITTFFMDRTGINVLINIAISIGLYIGLLYALKEKFFEEINSFKESLRASN